MTPAGGASDLSCAKQTEEAKHVPVDMYIMLDRSESMLGVTGTGETKWDALRGALGKFISDPRSTGLSVGLQYFPIGKTGVPTSCTDDAACGAAGPCMTRLCQPPANATTFTPIYCATDGECAADSMGCQQFGLCERDNAVVCFNPTQRNGCGAMGACLRVQSECKGFSSCDPASYAMPDVPIGELPGQMVPLTNSLVAASPIGLTPTSAALGGALRQAEMQAKAQPAHKVIALLATDGLPTECEPTDIAGVAQIAELAAGRTPALNTYVVGVFSAEETMAQMNLDAWAKAGGTEKAFILDPMADVSAQFLDALEKIRGGTLSCEYAIPPSPQGSEIDLGFVNVSYVTDQETRPLGYVGDPAGCGRTALGWHYDADPNSGTATKIVACPQTCDTLKATGGRVEVSLGCKTAGPQ